MREIDPAGQLIVEVSMPSGKPMTVDIAPHWETRFNADGVQYQADDELVLLPWPSILRVRQPLGARSSAPSPGAASLDIERYDETDSQS